MPTTPSDEGPRVRATATTPDGAPLASWTTHSDGTHVLDGAPTRDPDPRVRAAASFSYAFAIIAMAEDQLMESVPMTAAEFTGFAIACNGLRRAADEIMAPHQIADVLEQLEEIARDATLPHQHMIDLLNGQTFITRAGREQILTAIVDTRREAMEDETPNDAEPGKR